MNSYCKIINEYLEKEDSEYLKKLHPEKEKVDELEKFIQTIKNKDLVSIDEYDKIVSFAKSKGGFLTSKNRKILFLKAFGVDDNNKNRMVFILQKEERKKDDGHDTQKFMWLKKSKNFLKDSPDSKIIDNDCKRSKISIMFKDEKIEDEEKENFIQQAKNNLYNFIITLSCINNNVYSYYQGYHDTGLYFLLLFNKDDEFDQGVSCFQRFSEFFLKENFLVKDNTFNFTICLAILKYIINLIDPEVQGYLNQVMNEGYCTFSMPWILSCFTHVVNDTSMIYRLLDYFIVTHPISIYHMTAWIIINKLRHCEKIPQEDSSLFVLFEGDFIETVDFESVIEKSEKSMKQYPVEEMEKFFKGEKLKRYFPLAFDKNYSKQWNLRLNFEEINGSFVEYVKGMWKVGYYFFFGK